MSDYTLITKGPVTGLVIDHLVVDALIATWGYKYWNWEEESLHVKEEDWFDKDSDTGSDSSQHLYTGVGISLSNLADRSEVNVLKNLFEFYQPGHTYVETDIWSR